MSPKVFRPESYRSKGSMTSKVIMYQTLSGKVLQEDLPTMQSLPLESLAFRGHLAGSVSMVNNFPISQSQTNQRLNGDIRGRLTGRGVAPRMMSTQLYGMHFARRRNSSQLEAWLAQSPMQRRSGRTEDLRSPSEYGIPIRVRVAQKALDTRGLSRVHCRILGDETPEEKVLREDIRRISRVH